MVVERSGMVGRAFGSQARQLWFESYVSPCRACRENSFILHCSSSPGRVKEYLAIGINGCSCTNNLRSLIVAWLGASHRSRDDAQLNRCAGE